MLLLTTPSTIWLGLKIWSKKFSHFETFWIRSIANDNFSNRPISRYIAQVYFYKTLHHKMWLQLLRWICLTMNLPLQKQKSITSDVAKPRAGGASYDWGRSSNTDWEVHVMICKNEDHSVERRSIIEIIILVYFRARVAIGGGAENWAGQVFLALRILTKIWLRHFDWPKP